MSTTTTVLSVMILVAFLLGYFLGHLDAEMKVIDKEINKLTKEGKQWN